MKLVDLHVHSTISDGMDTPEELVRLAVSVPLTAFALTDHDTLGGIARAKAASQVFGEGAPRVIPGVEISAAYGGRDIHILGLFIDETNAALNKLLSDFRSKRDLRNQQMIQRFCDAGIPMTLEELSFGHPHAIITRAHFARLLMDKGYATDRSDAFERYVGDTAPFYIPREYIDPAEAIRCIHEAGGIAILAHPLSYHFSNETILNMVRELKEAGIDGIETLYGAYSEEQVATVRELAMRFGLPISGGSDYHGSNKPGLMLGTGYGKLQVPIEVLEKLENLL